LASGIPLSELSPKERSSLPGFLAGGYLLGSAWERGSLVLSQSGRLIADRIVREILV